MSSSTSPLVSNPNNKVGSTIVLKSLSILLGLFFIFIGAMKISPYLSKELHKDLVSRKQFVQPLLFLFSFLFYTQKIFFQCQIVVFVTCSSFHCNLCVFKFYLQRKEYVKYAKVFPLSSIFDFKIPSKWYRRVVGGLEVACGLVKLFTIYTVRQK